MGLVSLSEFFVPFVGTYFGFVPPFLVLAITGRALRSSSRNFTEIRLRIRLSSLKVNLPFKDLPKLCRQVVTSRLTTLPGRLS